MMKHRIWTIALSICCCLLPACEANTGSHPTHTASNTAIATEIAHQQAILIDVRTADEYAAGHAAQAILVPYDVIEQKIAPIAPDKNQKIYLYCRSGRRSAIATETLKGMGYTNVTDLGGLGQLGQYGLRVGQ
ncbi:MAG: rhodanese-like domain-containing protein [Burkholderiaceae bacterium]